MTNKICVYTVCCNEAKYVEKFMKSASEADCVTALVHDCTDDTAERLMRLGCKVKFTHYDFWRFDTSKNDALAWAKEAAPDCNIFNFVSLDEVWEPGWAQIVRDRWQENTEICLYKFVQSHDDFGNEALTTGFNWMHNRDEAWYWKYPVDEVLIRDDKPVEQLIYLNLFDDIKLQHWPDWSKPRYYLELHKLRYEENPNEDSCILCLTRDYHAMSAWDEQDKLLENKNVEALSINGQEKSFIFMCMGDRERSRGDYKKALEYFHKSLESDPNFRDTYVQMAQLFCDMKAYVEAEHLLKKALTTTWRTYSYLENPDSWDVAIPVWLTVATYYQENKQLEAWQWASIAYKRNPQNELTKTNYELCWDAVKGKTV